MGEKGGEHVDPFRHAELAFLLDENKDIFELCNSAAFEGANDILTSLNDEEVKVIQTT